MAELSKGGTSIGLATSSASTLPSAESSSTSSYPSGVTASRTRLRASAIEIRSVTRRNLLPKPAPVRRLREYDHGGMPPVRGPLSRLDRARDELAKAWLVRLIERASLDEIRELPTERIAKELPDLISELVRTASDG